MLPRAICSAIDPWQATAAGGCPRYKPPPSYAQLIRNRERDAAPVRIRRQHVVPQAVGNTMRMSGRLKITFRIW